MVFMLYMASVVTSFPSTVKTGAPAPPLRAPTHPRVLEFSVREDNQIGLVVL